MRPVLLVLVWLVRPNPARPESCRGTRCSYGETGDARPCAGARECRGVECPDGPGPVPVHVAGRAAQLLGGTPDFGFPSAELGAAPLGVQLTCDIKPRGNEVPSEDALVLPLQLAQGQETLVEALRAQQGALL